MMDWKEMIKRLEIENEMVDTTEQQREANKWRIKQLKLLNRPKSPDYTYEPLKPIQERLKDKSIRITPNKLLTE